VVNHVGPHLTLDEFDRLLVATSPVDPRVQAHLEDCAECRRRYALHREIDQMLRMTMDEARAGTGACPPAEHWSFLAAGVLPSAEAETLHRHAAACPACSRRLREGQEDLQADLTAAERLTVAGLASSREEWQAVLSRRLLEQARSLQSPSQARAAVQSHAFAWAGAGRPWLRAAVLLVACAAGWFWWTQHREVSTPTLLARAYAQQRTLQLRFSGGLYGPLRQQRGAVDGSAVERSPDLLEAEARLARALGAAPDDAALLDAKARADLLEWHAEAALASLQRALAVAPESPDIKTDLAAAYFERAEMGAAQDYGAAAQTLGEVLAVHPDDAVARFNRAIVYEQLTLYGEAVADWQRYLRGDAHSPWADEARAHLQQDEQHLAQHSGHAAVVRPRDAGRAGFADPEAALHTAVPEWLPAVASPPSIGGASESQALQTLAAELVVTRHDRWLQDFMAGPAARRPAADVALLTEAIRRNQTGDPSGALSQGQRAEARLAMAGNVAGALRARFETVYALHRLQSAARCRRAAEGLRRQAMQRDYSWLQIQATLEDAGCTYLDGGMEEARRLAARARVESQAAGYGSLELRSLGAVVEISDDLGDTAEGWRRGLQGLQRYWNGQFAPLRGYEFYASLGSAAERAADWFLADALVHASVRLAADSQNIGFEAMSRQRLGRLDAMIGNAREATDEFARADVLFAALPATQGTRNFRLYGDIAQSVLEMQQGRTQAALTRLRRVKPALQGLEGVGLSLPFYTTLGNAYWQTGDIPAAEQSFAKAVTMIATGASALGDDGDRMFWQRDNLDAYRALTELRLTREHDPAGALALWEQARAEAGGATSNPASPGPLVVRAISPSPDVSVLTYALLPHGLAIWKRDADGLHFQWQSGSPQQLLKVAGQFVAHCASPNSPPAALRSEGRALYDWLLGPLSARLTPGQTLVIEPDGPLGEVPFSALVSADGEYLAARFPLEYSPLLETRTTGTIAPAIFTSRTPALVVATPVAAGLSALPDAGEEAQAVAARLPGAVLLEGEAATLAAVRRALPGAALVHFAGHADANHDRGALLLAPARHGDGPVPFTAGSLTGIHLRRCRLVVLSACATAPGQTGGLFEPHSLVRAFLLAGATYVVANRWNVDSSSSRRLMDTFYDHLQQGSTVAEALRAAQQQQWKDPASRLPYYWAASAVLAHALIPMDRKER